METQFIGTKASRRKYGENTCIKKKKFSSRLKGWIFAVNIAKLKGIKMGVYKCYYCSKYHLSSKILYTPPSKALKHRYE